MSNDRPKRETMSIKEATISNMWEITAIVELLEQKGLCTKQDLYDIITEFRRTNPRAKVEVCANTMTVASPKPGKSCLTNRGERAGAVPRAFAVTIRDLPAML